MKDIITKTLAVVGVILLVLMIIGFVMDNTNESQDYNGYATKKAQDQSYKNAFISGCTSEGSSRSDCVCMFNTLVDIHPDLTEDYSITGRMLTEGFSEYETDQLVAKCL